MRSQPSLLPKPARMRDRHGTSGSQPPIWGVLLDCGKAGKPRGGETPAPFADDHCDSLAEGPPPARRVGARLLQAHSLSLRYADPERILVVTADHPHATAAKLLWQVPESNIIAQPKDLDTAPALALALAHILRIEPNASILGISGDRMFSPECLLSEVIFETLQAMDDLHHVSAVVFGISPGGPSHNMDWLLPDRSMDEECAESYPRRLARFIEQPRHDVAQKLFCGGGLWNTSIFAGKARALWYLLGKRMPDTLPLVARHFGLLKSGDKGISLADLYDRVPPASFWSQIMAREPAEFLLVPLPLAQQTRLQPGKAEDPDSGFTARAVSPSAAEIRESDGENT